MSTIKTNTLTGTTSAGSIDVTGEGGSTTTNLQQGLVKAFLHFDQKGDSGSVQYLESNNFNVSGFTDNSTGVSTHAFINNFSNQYHSTTATGIDRATSNVFISGPETTTSTDSIKLTSLSGAPSAIDPDSLMAHTCGDLA